MAIFQLDFISAGIFVLYFKFNEKSNQFFNYTDQQNKKNFFFKSK